MDLHVNISQSEPVEERCHSGLVIISRGTAIMLLFVYAAYLFFQLKTHAYLFKPRSRTQNQDRDGDQDEEQAQGQIQAQPEEEEEELRMAPVAAGFALLFVTVVTSFAADYRECTCPLCA